MRKMKIISGVIVLLISMNLSATEKNAFGRENLLIGADPTTMKLMAAVASKADSKLAPVKPKMELRDPGKALKLLCRGSGARYPDMVASARAMNLEEYERCQSNNIGSVIKIKIGYEALVVAADKKAMDLNLDQRDLYLALAKDVPKADQQGIFHANPYQKWKDIDAELPAQTIKVFGPADKTRDARTVSTLGMENGCRTWDWIAALKHIQKSYRIYREVCWVQREDGHYVKAESKDMDLTKYLLANNNSIGLMGFNTWEKSKSKLKAYTINDLPPTMGTISKGLYPLSRSLYVYIKVENLKKVKSLSYFMNELLSDEALGENGYLADIGLVTMPEKELKREKEQAYEFTNMPEPDES